ncbi:MAG: hypothetical protein ACMXYC_02680 [Candidatus Woesearchaeota archaeon]
MNKKINKKAVDTNQMFVFVISLVIVGLVLLFGTRTILQFNDRQSEIQYLQFQNNLEDRFENLRYGETRYVDMRVPRQFRHICFIDISDELRGSLPGQTRNVTTDDNVHHRPITSTWEDIVDRGSQIRFNVFLIEQQVSRQFYVENLHINSTKGYECFDIINKNLQFYVENKGTYKELRAVT